ncbi:MAG: CbtB domain-containing protein [Pseudomonadota bacterium]
MITATKTAFPSSLLTGASSAVVALLLGLSLLFVSAFAGAEPLHNSAHDTRHSTGFPCH